jgi:hypothetical protein
LKLLPILILFSLSLFAINGEDNRRIILSKIEPNKFKMRVYFNYENPFDTKRDLIGRLTHYYMKLPIEDRVNVEKMRVQIKYTPSIVLSHKRSYVSIISNEHVIRQFPLLEKKFQDVGSSTITAEIPIGTLKEFNDIGVQIIQHYSFGLSNPEDPSAPELRSQVDLQNSFVEYEFTYKNFEERISSIERFMFDNKAIDKGHINFVFPKRPLKEHFFYYGFMANLIGQILKYRDVDFSVSTSILDEYNNILIMDRKEAENLFYENGYYKDLNQKLSGNINMIRNFNRRDNGILVVTGGNSDEITSSLYRMATKDIMLLEDQNIKVFHTKIPPKAKPYSSPGFASPNSKIMFSDLGIKTKTFSGEQSADLFMNFKIYPNFSFDNRQIESYLNILYGKIIRADSAINIFLNNQFAYQIPISEVKNGEVDKKHSISADLLRKGINSFVMEMALVPIYGPQLLRFNDDVLKATVQNNSYISLPLVEGSVELPNLQYASELAFPFSIYPDLQNSGILITDLDTRTVASAMYVAFFLGKKIGYPAYYLTISPDINDVITKDMVVVGKHIKEYSILYKNAPIKFTKDGVIKELGIQSKFIDDEGIRKKSFTQKTKIKEGLQFKDHLIVQTYKSPFNSKRVVIDISAQDPETLINGIKNGFKSQHLNNFSGDVWFYNIHRDESNAYQMRETYIFDNLIINDD